MSIDADRNLGLLVADQIRPTISRSDCSRKRLNRAHEFFTPNSVAANLGQPRREESATPEPGPMVETMDGPLACV